MNAENGFLPIFAILRGKKVPKNLEGLKEADIFCSSNKNAWMTTDIFFYWIKLIWEPYARQFKRTLLIMDKFSVHKKQEIIALLQSLNTDVVIIPGGLTYYVQPCDIYVNGPLKRQMRKRWQEHITSQLDCERIKKNLI